MPIEQPRLGERIAQVRTRRRWSQSALAEEAGISRPYLSQIERGGDHEISAEKLDRLALALGWPNFNALYESDALEPPTEPGRNGTMAGVETEGGVAGIMARLLEEIEELRRAVRSVPRYESGACGDPREGDIRAVGYQQIPDGRETAVGRRGFAVSVVGESMASRGIHEGDVVFVNPDRPWALGSIVLARVDGEGMVVKEVGIDERGRTVLWSNGGNGLRSQVPGSEFAVIGPVVVHLSVQDLANGHPKGQERAGP